MKERKGLSGALTLGLAGLLCLLFALSLLPLSAGASPAPETRAISSPPERILAGADEEGRLPSELLPGEKLDLNTASAPELERLPGIGEKLAAAIVGWREANGPFRSPEDLLQVPGIGEKRLEAIRDLVTVSSQTG